MTTRNFLLIIAVAAFGIRVGAVALSRGLQAPPSPRHGADGIEYDALGLGLALGRGYTLPGWGPTSFRAPGFPLFLAGINLAAGHSYPAAYLGFALLGSASCLLAYALAREVSDESTSRLAAALAAFYPPHVYFATRFDSENLFVPALAASTWAFLAHLRADRPWSTAVAGAGLGLATLTRPFAILIAPAWLAILTLRRSRPPRRRAASAITFLIAFVLVVAPWTARNVAVHGRFVLVATNGGSTFYGGNNDLVSGDLARLGTWVSTGDLPGRAAIEVTPDEVAHDHLEWSLGLQWVREHTGKLPRILAGKLARLWLPDVDSPSQAYVAVQVLSYSPFLALIIVGWLVARRRRDYRGSAWLAIRVTLAATVATAAIFWGSPRFRDANTPALMTLAAIGLVGIAGRAAGAVHDVTRPPGPESVDSSSHA